MWAKMCKAVGRYSRIRVGNLCLYYWQKEGLFNKEHWKRFSDWLIGTVSRGRQSNSDVPHSGYFEELRVCAFRVGCASFSPVYGACFTGLQLSSELISITFPLFFLRRTCRRFSMMLPLLFFAVVAGVARASDVLEFTDDDFESRIGDHDLVLVEFFAPW